MGPFFGSLGWNLGSLKQAPIVNHIAVLRTATLWKCPNVVPSCGVKARLGTLNPYTRGLWDLDAYQLFLFLWQSGAPLMFEF